MGGGASRGAQARDRSRILGERGGRVPVGRRGATRRRSGRRCRARPGTETAPGVDRDVAVEPTGVGRVIGREGGLRVWDPPITATAAWGSSASTESPGSVRATPGFAFEIEVPALPGPDPPPLEMPPPATSGAGPSATPATAPSSVCRTSPAAATRPVPTSPAPVATAGSPTWTETTPGTSIESPVGAAASPGSVAREPRATSTGGTTSRARLAADRSADVSAEIARPPRPLGTERSSRLSVRMAAMRRRCADVRARRTMPIVNSPGDPTHDNTPRCRRDGGRFAASVRSVSTFGGVKSLEDHGVPPPSQRSSERLRRVGGHRAKGGRRSPADLSSGRGRRVVPLGRIAQPVGRPGASHESYRNTRPSSSVSQFVVISSDSPARGFGSPGGLDVRLRSELEGDAGFSSSRCKRSPCGRHCRSGFPARRPVGSVGVRLESPTYPAGRIRVGTAPIAGRLYWWAAAESRESRCTGLDGENEEAADPGTGAPSWRTRSRVRSRARRCCNWPNSSTTSKTSWPGSRIATADIAGSTGRS